MSFATWWKTRIWPPDANRPRLRVQWFRGQQMRWEARMEISEEDCFVEISIFWLYICADIDHALGCKCGKCDWLANHLPYVPKSNGHGESSSPWATSAD